MVCRKNGRGQLLIAYTVLKKKKKKKKIKYIYSYAINMLC